MNILHFNKPNKNMVRMPFVILTILVAIALLIGGTLALSQFSQNQSKQRRDAEEYNVTLNNQFQPVQDWKVGQTASKQVSVTNQEGSPDEMLVRLSLKEFMQTRRESAGTIKDKKGNAVLFATVAEGENIGQYLTVQDAAELVPNNAYGSMSIQTGVDQDGKPIYTEYATTNSTEIRNGIYGKTMSMPGEVEHMWGVPIDEDAGHEIENNELCDYTPYLWDGIGALSNHANEQDRTGIRNYITFTAPTVTLKAWAEDIDPETGAPKWGDFWIVDSHDGWAYWGTPLAPGKTTKNLIDSVTLNQLPGTATFDYVMHLDMQAIAGDEVVFAQELTQFNDRDATENRTQKQNLLDAMSAFIRTRERAALKALLDSVAEYLAEDHTKNSWGAFEGEWESANKVYGNPDPTARETIEGAVTDLTTAIDQLVNIAYLRELVELADPLEWIDYTPVTWEPFETARTDAQNVLADDGATQTAVDDAAKELYDTMTALELASLGPIHVVFPDKIAQLIVAQQLDPENESIDYEITPRDVANVQGNMWQSIFLSTADTPEDKKIGSIEGIEHFVNMTALYLSYNKLTSLPDNLGHLTDLRAPNNQLSSLPETIGNWNLERLEVNNNNLKSIPENISDLTSLTFLNLHSNGLQSLPKNIGNLTGLTSLALYSNELESLPESIGKLTGLTSLALYSNFLESLPESIGNLTGLTSLNVNTNRLQSLPESIGNLTGLRSLNVYNNRLQSLPESIGDLENLTNLTAYSNELESLPESIGDVKSLSYLDFNNNRLTRIPESIKSLQNLTTLTMHSQTITLPDQDEPVSDGRLTLENPIFIGNDPVAPQTNTINPAGNYYADTNTIQWTGLTPDIEQVRFGFNTSVTTNSASGTFSGNVTMKVEVIGIGRIEDIFTDENAADIVATDGLPHADGDTSYMITPSDIADTTGDAWKNIFRGSEDQGDAEKIASMEGIQHFVHLTHLDLSFNKLTELPDSMVELSELQELWAGNNKLESLPDNIGDLENLTLLYLDNNEFKGLPDHIGDLKSLADLRVDENQLQSLPDRILELSNLKTLWVDHNHLTGLPDGWGKQKSLESLESLALHNNALGSLPDNWASLGSLKSLQLQNNELTGGLPQSIGDLTNLTYLNLNNNKLTELPVEIKNWGNLTELYLNDNELTELPVEIGSLESLTALHLNKNQLTSLPVELGQLGDLRTLNAEDQETELERHEGSPVITVDNPISFFRFDAEGTPLLSSITPSPISNSGEYHEEPLNQIIWKALRPDQPAVSFSFSEFIMISSNGTNHQVGRFSGFVVVPVTVTIPEGPVDRTELERAIKAAETYPPRDYTARSWNYLQTLLEEGRNVFNDEDAMQWEIDDATEALDKAVDALVDISSLYNLFMRATDKQEEDYTPESWEPFAVAMEAAADILFEEADEQGDYLDITPDQVDKTEQTLQQAIDGLRPNGATVDRSELLALINHAKTLIKDDHTKGSWSSFSEVLTEAERVYAWEHATQRDIDTAKDDLERAINDLVDITILRALVEQSKQFDQSLYTVASWNAFAEVQGYAQTVLDKADASQIEVDNAVNGLQFAIDSLIRKAYDLEELRKAIERAKALEEEDYAPVTWASLPPLLAEGIYVFDNAANATQPEVDDAADTLNEALDNLVYIAELRDLIAESLKKNEENYFSDRWTIFANALGTAQQVLADDKITQAKVTTAIENLHKGIDQLMIRESTPVEGLEAVHGRILRDAQTGDGDWLEIAQYGEYSLVLAQNNIQTTPSGAKFASVNTRYFNQDVTSTLSANLRARMNVFWTHEFTGFPVRYLPLDARIRMYAVRGEFRDSNYDSDAVYTQVLNESGFRLPTSTLAGTNDRDVVFALSLQEAFQFYSKQHKHASNNSITDSPSIAQENFAHFLVQRSAWTRTNGGFVFLLNDAGVLETVHFAIAQRGGLAAMWVKSTIFTDQGDRSKLWLLLDQANRFVAADFTTDSWSSSNIVNVRNDANAAYNNPDATQQQLDEAAEKLEQAMAKLVNIAALRQAIARAGALNQSDYTFGSWTHLQNILAAANTIVGKANATQQEVDDATMSLNNAMSALVNIVKLRNLVEEANKLIPEGYSADSWNFFWGTWLSARATLNDGNALQSDVDSATSGLQSGMNALTPELQAIARRTANSTQTGAGNWAEIAKYGEYSLVLYAEANGYMGWQRWYSTNRDVPWYHELSEKAASNTTYDNALNTIIRERANDFWNHNTNITDTPTEHRISSSARIRDYAVVPKNVIGTTGGVPNDHAGFSLPTGAAATLSTLDVTFPLSYQEAYHFYSRYNTVGGTNVSRVSTPQTWLRTHENQYHRISSIFRLGDDGWITNKNPSETYNFRPAMWVKSSLFTD